MTQADDVGTMATGSDRYPEWLQDLVGDGNDATYTGKKLKQQMDEKLAIACYVTDHLVPDTGCVFLEAGSTLRIVARAAFANAIQKGLSLIAATNNLDISDDFVSARLYRSESDITLHLTGGKHDRNHHALFGELATATLESVFPESIIIGSSGFTFTEGLFYHGGTEEGTVKRALYSKEVDCRILTIDHSKLGRRDMFLCENYGREAIKGLCKKVRDKTVIVTSVPPKSGRGSGKRSLDVENWEREMWYVEKRGRDGLPEDNEWRENVEMVRGWLDNGSLEVIVVVPLDRSPYYVTHKVYPSRRRNV